MTTRSELAPAAAPAVIRQRPPVPRVNLLPPEVREATRLRVVQGALVGGVLGASALVAVISVHVGNQAEQARVEYEAAAAARAEVSAQVAELGPVRDVYTQVEAAEALVTQAQSLEVSWSRLLSDLSVIVPDDVWVETLSVTPSSVGADGQTTGGSVGMITYTGRGRSHDDVATWIESLEAQESLEGATFSASTVDRSKAEPTVSFSATVNVSAEALTNGADR